MRSIEMLKSLWNGSINYLFAQDVPGWTRSVADGVRRLLTTPLVTLQHLVVTSPPRLLISVMLIAVLLSGAWIISVI